MSHNPLIFALDYDNGYDATKAAEKLRGVVGTFKVGLELFVMEGPGIVRDLMEHGDVFVDLKMHDIPTTVLRACKIFGKVAEKDPRLKFVTVHAGGGLAMLEDAVQAAAPAKVLAVTVLTSMNTETLWEVGVHAPVAEYGAMQLQVMRLARLARRAGCGGVICAPPDLLPLRLNVPPGLLYVTPGVRPAGANADDQSRFATPTGAVEQGADYLVVGRPIRDAADPVEAAKAILAEAQKAWKLSLPGVEV
jgi:orotidine-5'-phosphate decarboxylase